MSQRPDGSPTGNPKLTFRFSSPALEERFKKRAKREKKTMAELAREIVEGDMVRVDLEIAEGERQMTKAPTKEPQKQRDQFTKLTPPDPLAIKPAGARRRFPYV